VLYSGARRRRPGGVLRAGDGRRRANMQAVIERASHQDLEAVQRLLTEHHLPLDGLADHMEAAFVARMNGRVVGSAALELYAGGALLRSVAVTSTLHGEGLGRELTEAAIRLAASRRVPAIYLLTTTAETFFPRFGFELIRRDEVPASVRTSIEFASACPASAIVMRKILAAGV